MEYCGLALARVNWPYDPFAPCPVHELHGIRLDIARHPTHGIAEKSRCRMPDALTISLLALAWLTPLAMVRAAPESRGGAFPCPSCRAQERTIGRCASCRPGAAVAQDHLLPRSTSPREHRVRSFRLAALGQGGRLGFRLEWGEPLASKYSEPQAPSRPRRRWSSPSCRLSWGTSGKKDHGCKRLPNHVDIGAISVSYLSDSSLI